MGDVIGHVIQDDGSTFLATIRNVSYMPDIICNLYSTTTAIANGMKISNLKDVLILKSGKTSLRFSHKFTSAKGFVSAFKFRPSNDLIPDYGLINIMDFHKQLGHPNQQSTKETAEKMQVTLEGRWETCEACSLAKSKQKIMNQVNEHRLLSLEKDFIQTSVTLMVKV